MKKKLISALMSIVLVFTFSGCTGTSEPEPVTPTETITQEVTPSPPETSEPETVEPEVPLTDEQKDEVFLQVVRDEYPELNSVPDSDLIQLPKQTCKAFDQGATLDEVLGVVAENANSPAEAEAIAFTIGAGIPVYCPEYMDKFEDLDGGNTV